MALLEIVSHELSAALRTRRMIVTAVLFVGIGSLAALFYFVALREAQQVAIAALAEQGVPPEMVAELLRNQSDEIAMAVLDRLGPGWDAFAPPLKLAYVVPVFFAIALGGLPWMVAGASFDLFASDLRARTLCYWSMRVPRRTLVLGRVIAQLVVIGAAILCVGLVTTVLGATLMADFSAVRALAGFGYATCLLLPPAAAYVAIVAFASSLTRSPLAAGALSVGLLLGLSMLRIPQHIIEEGSPGAVLHHLRLLSPGWWTDGLWAASPVALLGSIAAYSAFAIVFTALAAATLRRHDL